jgi:hypothetical protein
MVLLWCSFFAELDEKDLVVLKLNTVERVTDETKPLKQRADCLSKGEGDSSDYSNDDTDEEQPNSHEDIHRFNLRGGIAEEVEEVSV